MPGLINVSNAQIPTQSLLAELRMYRTQNSVKQFIQAARASYVGNDVVSRSITLASPVSFPEGCTALAMQVDFNGPVVLTGVRKADNSTITLTITSMLVLDDPLSSFSLSSPNQLGRVNLSYQV